MTAIINSNPLKNNNCRENIYLVSLDLIKLVNLLSYLIIRAKMRKKYIKPKNSTTITSHSNADRRFIWTIF